MIFKNIEKLEMKLMSKKDFGGCLGGKKWDKKNAHKKNIFALGKERGCIGI